MKKVITITLTDEAELEVKIDEFPAPFAPAVIIELIKQFAMGVDMPPFALLEAVVQEMASEELAKDPSEGFEPRSEVAAAIEPPPIIT